MTATPVSRAGGWERDDVPTPPDAAGETDDSVPHDVLGILGAMEDEVRLLRAALTQRREETIFGVRCHFGYLDGHPVVLARSGVGKVNAALATVALVRAGSDALIFTGVAGAVAPELGVGDIVIGVDAVQHDIDVTALGNRPGELMGEPFSFHCSRSLSELALRAATRVAGDSTVVAGRIASGDQFIADPSKVTWIRDNFDAHCAEMEGAAFAQTAFQLGRPAAIVRTISDTADGSAHVDFPAFLEFAAPRGLELMRAFVAEWTAA